MRGLKKIGVIFVLVFLSSLMAIDSVSSEFAVNPGEEVRDGKSYSQFLDEWNYATWNDIVDDDFSNQGLAAVRWYTTEGQCEGEKCEEQLHNGNGRCPGLDVSENRFCGVTDEFGNVLLSHAMGNNEERYLKLHTFSEKLRVPETNNLQCWMYYIQGKKDYDDYEDLCVETDSASDASIRILGAYSIACAKQKTGLWTQRDYCTDYEQQGKAIFGLTGGYGEIKKLENGRYFLANGYNNNVGAPTAAQSIRPDYYELQFLMDFAEYMDSDELRQAVRDILETYKASLGSSMIHKGKTGHFSADGITGYECDDLCSPEYMDNIDTWRAIPAISGLFNVYYEKLSDSEKELFFDWWNLYVKPYSATEARPFEIYSEGDVKSTEMSYKTLSMWIPLSVQIDKEYTKESLDYLINNIYNSEKNHFSGSAYYGGYFSQFAQRAIGASTGMMSPGFWSSWDGSSSVVIPQNGSGSSSEEINNNEGNEEENIENISEGNSNTEEFLVENLKFNTTLNKKSDSTNGDCRTVIYETSGEDLEILACKKGDSLIEAYRQNNPGIKFRIDIENDYLDEIKGFAKITEITSKTVQTESSEGLEENDISSNAEIQSSGSSESGGGGGSGGGGSTSSSNTNNFQNLSLENGQAKNQNGINNSEKNTKTSDYSEKIIIQGKNLFKENIPKLLVGMGLMGVISLIIFRKNQNSFYE